MAVISSDEATSQTRPNSCITVVNGAISFSLPPSLPPSLPHMYGLVQDDERIDHCKRPVKQIKEMDHRYISSYKQNIS
jgi:hypothetical protein